MPERILTNKEGKPVKYSQTAAHFENLGVMTIHPDGSISLKLIPTKDFGKEDPRVRAVLDSVKAVYAGVLSKGAQDVFDRYGIAYAYGTLTDSIINRMGTGLCPMELAVKDLDDPAAAPAALREKLKQLSNSR